MEPKSPKLVRWMVVCSCEWWKLNLFIRPLWHIIGTMLARNNEFFLVATRREVTHGVAAFLYYETTHVIFWKVVNFLTIIRKVSTITSIWIVVRRVGGNTRKRIDPFSCTTLQWQKQVIVTDWPGLGLYMNQLEIVSKFR